MVFSYGGILCSNEKLKLPLWAVTWVNLINILAKKKKEKKSTEDKLDDSMILVTESSQQPKLICVLEAGFMLTLAANDYNEGRRSCGNCVNFSFLTWAVMNSLNGYDVSIFSEDTSKLYICLCFMSPILPLGRWYCGWGHHPK